MPREYDKGDISEIQIAKWLKRAEFVARISLSLAEDMEKKINSECPEVSIAYGAHLDARNLVTLLGGE